MRRFYARHVRGSLKAVCVAITLLSINWLSPSAEAEVIDRIVAKVNDDIITLNDLKRASGPHLLAFGIEPRDLPRHKDAAKIYRDILEDMINVRLLVQQAETFQLEVTEDDVSQWINNIRSQQNLSEDQFRDALLEKGIRWHDYRRYVHDNLLKFRVIQVKIGSRVKITEEEVVKAYKSQFKAPPGEGVATVDVSHIFIPKPEGDPEGVAAAEKLIASLHGRLEGGENFAALAAEASAGPTASDGGRLGKYRPGELDKEIDNVVFELEVDQFSKPIEVASGFHIFIVNERIVERDPKVEERLAKVRAQLKEIELNRQLDVWLDSLRQKAYVRVMF